MQNYSAAYVPKSFEMCGICFPKMDMKGAGLHQRPSPRPASRSETGVSGIWAALENDFLTSYHADHTEPAARKMLLFRPPLTAAEGTENELLE
jgi:hypothetical protein